MTDTQMPDIIYTWGSEAGSYDVDKTAAADGVRYIRADLVPDDLWEFTNRMREKDRALERVINEMHSINYILDRVREILEKEKMLPGICSTLMTHVHANEHIMADLKKAILNGGNENQKETLFV